MREEAIYKVNRENDVCTAIICDCALDAVKEFYKQTQYDLALKKPELFIMDDKFVGTARCSPEDEFNERIGKNLAFQRAYEKYLKQKKRILLDISDYIDRRSEIIQNYTKENKKFKRLGE